MISLNEIFEKLHSTQELINDEDMCLESEVADYLHTMDGFLRNLVMQSCCEQGLSIDHAMTNFINRNGLDKNCIEI